MSAAEPVKPLNERDAVDSLAAIKAALAKSGTRGRQKEKAPAEPVPDAVEPHTYCPRTGMPIAVSKLEARRVATRARNTPQQAARRAKKRAEKEASEAAHPIDPAEIAALLAAIPEPEPIGLDALRGASASLSDWFKINGRRQKLMQPRRKVYEVVQRVWLLRRHRLGQEPSPADLSEHCNKQTVRPIDPITRNAAGYMIKQLREIEAECGPWCRPRDGIAR